MPSHNDNLTLTPTQYHTGCKASEVWNEPFLVVCAVRSMRGSELNADGLGTRFKG